MHMSNGSVECMHVYSTKASSQATGDWRLHGARHNKIQSLATLCYKEKLPCSEHNWIKATHMHPLSVSGHIKTQSMSMYTYAVSQFQYMYTVTTQVLLNHAAGRLSIIAARLPKATLSGNPVLVPRQHAGRRVLCNYTFIHVDNSAQYIKQQETNHRLLFSTAGACAIHQLCTNEPRPCPVPTRDIISTPARSFPGLLKYVYLIFVHTSGLNQN